jgi:hypothetical protein
MKHLKAARLGVAAVLAGGLVLPGVEAFSAGQPGRPRATPR